MPDKQDIIPLIYGTRLFRFFLLVMLFISLLYGQQSLVILSLILLTLFSLARIWCRFSQRGLECRLFPVKEKIFAGETTILKAQVRNHKLLPIWLEVKVVLDKPLDIDKSLTSQDQIPSFTNKTAVHGESGLLWKQQAEWEWELKPAKRGQYNAGPIHLCTGDIFGFYRSFSETVLNKKITVYPRLVKLNPLSPLFKELFGLPGSKSPVVDPIYPVSTRDYSESRPARHIHWKASARHNRLQEKVFEPSTQEKILLIIDVHGFSEETDLLFEKTLEVAASLAVSFETKGRTFGLVSNGIITSEKNSSDAAILPAGIGSQQLLLLLDILARLKQTKHNLSLVNLLQQAIQGSGITALYFNRSMLDSDKNIIDLLNQLKVPLISISADNLTSCNPGTYSLDQLINDGEIAAG